MPYTENDIWIALQAAAAKRDIYTVAFYAGILRDIHNEAREAKEHVLKW